MTENARHTYAHLYTQMFLRGGEGVCVCVCSLDTDGLQMQMNDRQMTIPVIVSPQTPPPPHPVCAIHQGRVERGGVPSVTFV